MAGEPTTTPLLLRTKLHAPTRRRGTIGRPRLDVGRPGRERPRLTLVSAPAGFGKTTLLAEWFADSPGATPRVGWLSLDARDDDPATFWAYMVAAVRAAAPGAGDAALDALASGGAATGAAVEALLADLEVLDDDVVIVLDDYHVIQSAEIHDGVALLVDRLPPRASLVVATRVDPPLPLARLRAGGDLVERRAADLRFTAEEAARYLNESMGLDLTSADVGALEERTEGWIAALQLAALSLQGRDDVAGFIDSFTGDDRFVVDYLVEEVLDRQLAPTRRFLLETSVLQRLSGALCDAVTGGTGGRATLEQLERANLFVVPLDDRRHWYRYHHLFADVLRARLLDEDPALVSELHRRAASWWADHDEPAEAITHALAGGDVDGAAALVELVAPSLQRARQEALLRRWLEALPDEVFASRPVLSMVLVGARMATGDMTGVDALLTGIEAWLDGGSTGEPIVADPVQFAALPAQAAVQRAGLALMSGDLAATTAYAERVLALVEPDDHVRRGSAAALLGLARWAVGDLDAARAHYAVAVERLVLGGHHADALGCSLALADMCFAQGRLRDADRAFAAGLDLVREHPGLRGAADMHAGLGELWLERNDLDRAREHLDESAALGEGAGLPQHAYRWRVATARLRLAEGDTGGALGLLDEAARHYDTDYSPSVRPVPAMVARVHIATGDLDAARRWVDRRGLGAGDELSYVTEYEYVTLARLLVATGIRERTEHGASELLGRLLDAATAGGRSGVAVECLTLVALARDAAGDRGAALDAIERALVLAHSEGIVRTFVDAGEPLAALLRTASFDGAAAEHGRVVLAASSGLSAPPPAGVLVDELSGRELDVLRLLRSDLSGPDIARELIVSLNTMRTHTKNIYAKLGVTNRREAVRRADQLGL